VTAVLGLVVPLLVLSAGPAAAQPPPGPLTGQPLPVTGRVATDKAPTSRVAQSDPELLARTDTRPVPVLVKLDYDSTATYAGGVGDLEATSPSVTGEPLTGDAGEQRYEQYAAGKEAAFAAELGRLVPGTDVEQTLRTVYGGVAITVPADRAGDVAALPGVVAVQQNRLNQPLTDASADFIGAPALYAALGAAVPDAGRGTILGNLDSGVWPEHPSFADPGTLPAPPGPARDCAYGDDPLTPEADPFVCNAKLIGGAHSTESYDAQVGDDPYAGTARDSDGHGTHTATTSAGGVVPDVSVLGGPLPAVHGVAPGAHVMEYKVCGPQGCFSADTAAAVGQAVLDGVDVINYSISGGTDPFTDATELAFLDAYAAGVFVAASAGNEGPGAATANHLAPWVTTVAASTQTRQFASTLTVTGPGGATFTAEGASITPGAGPAPLVPAGAAPYGRALCDAPAPAGAFTGVIVACERGGGSRVSKGYNVAQGGAVGMVLYNPTLADTGADNHWLPTVHLADGTAFREFLTANPGATASFTAGAAAPGRGDVMAAFSSRGPGGPTLKPDLTAPGVQILAGHTPTPATPDGGPPGQYFQAIAGTSMSSPHVAGAALLLAALHPDWTPGQIRSALMTTARTNIVQEDLTTPADPFDRGAGHIDLRVAGSPALTFDETAENMALLGADALTAVDLNLPSVNAPVLPGRLTTVRTATNTTDRTVVFRTEAVAPEGSRITVTPRTVSARPGQSVEMTITIESPTPSGVQQFGEVRLLPVGGRSGPALHLPVAFVPQQGGVALASSCDPATVTVRATTTCTVTAQNTSSTDTTADVATAVDRNLRITGAQGATATRDGVEARGIALRGSRPGVPAVDPGTSPAGFLPLEQFGIAPTPVGDEEFLNLAVPAYVFAGRTYTGIGVSSNGFVVAGTGEAADNNCCNLPTGPDAAPPNAVMAPFWTDLDGTGAPGIAVGTLTDGLNSWIVVEHRVNVFGSSDPRVFQTWIGTNGTEDVSFAYDPAALPAAPGGQAFLVGAENEAGEGDVEAVAPTGDLRVTSTDPTPGDSVSYTVTVEGRSPGAGLVTSQLTSPSVPGTTVVRAPVEVRRR
jgi:hypothetical protein